MAKFYSHSRLSTFEQCKLRFKYRYIDKIKPDIEKSIEAHLGSCVHDVLEWLYIEVKNNNIPTIDNLIVKYSEAWQKGYKPEIIIVKKQFTAKDYFNKGIQFILNYYTKHQPFQDGTLELEKRIKLNLDEKGEYKILGFIDRLVKNLETGEYEVHDYKTANSLPTQEKIDEDRQLALYAIAIKDIYGQDKEVCLVWHYLAHNKKLTSKRTNQQLALLKQETIQLIKEIETTTEFPPNKGILCGWCEYKQMCPAFNNQATNISENPKQESNIKVDTTKYPTISKYIKN